MTFVFAQSQLATNSPALLLIKPAPNTPQVLLLKDDNFETLTIESLEHWCSHHDFF